MISLFVVCRLLFCYVLLCYLLLVGCVLFVGMLFVVWWFVYRWSSFVVCCSMFFCLLFVVWLREMFCLFVDCVLFAGCHVLLIGLLVFACCGFVGCVCRLLVRLVVCVACWCVVRCAL